MVSKHCKETFARKLYADIKLEIITHRFLPGEWINVEQLSEQMRVSTTPVREVLSRLAGEGLVELRPQFGFLMRKLSESDLVDIYKVNQQLLEWCLDEIERNRISSRSLAPCDFSGQLEVPNVQDTLSSMTLARVTGDLFAYIAVQAENVELIAQIENINARLFHARAWAFELQSISHLQVQKIYDGCKNMNTELTRLAVQEYHSSQLSLVRILIRNMDKGRLSEQKSFMAQGE